MPDWCEFFMYFTKQYKKRQKGKRMFDLLKKLWHPDIALSNIADVSQKVVELLEYFEQQHFVAGENSRNAAIDALIQILQEEKTK